MVTDGNGTRHLVFAIGKAKSVPYDEGVSQFLSTLRCCSEPREEESVNTLQLSQSNTIATSSSETGAMNGTDQDAALGRLVREHREMKRRADEIAHTINNIGERLAALGAAMRVQNTQVASPARLASILSELRRTLRRRGSAT